MELGAALADAPSSSGGDAGGGASDAPSPALVAWLQSRLARELKRLAAAGQRAMELHVLSTGVVRRQLQLGASALPPAAQLVHRVMVGRTAFDFSKIEQILTSEPVPCGAVRPGFSHVFLVLLAAPGNSACPALLANYICESSLADDLHVFSIVTEAGVETLLEVRGAEVIAAD